MRGSAFQRYVAPAERDASLWRTLAGLGIIVLGWLVWTTVVLTGWVLPDVASGVPVGRAIARLENGFRTGEPAAIAVTLLTFAGIWPSTWVALRLVHRRRFRTVLGPGGGPAGDLALGVACALLLWLLGTLAGLLLVGMPQRSALGLLPWLLWLVPMAALVFLQAGGEELIFRGYLLQNLAALGLGPWAWAILPSLVFAFLHYDATRAEGINWLYIATVLVFGLIAVVLVWRTGALWAGIGFHAANNFGALTLIGVEGLTEGSQLFIQPVADKGMLIAIDFGVMALMLVWLASPACPRRLRGP